MNDGVFAANLHPASMSDLIWGMVEGAANAAVAHPDQKFEIQDAVTKAMQAVLQD